MHAYNASTRFQACTQAKESTRTQFCEEIASLRRRYSVRSWPLLESTSRKQPLRSCTPNRRFGTTLKDCGYKRAHEGTRDGEYKLHKDAQRGGATQRDGEGDEEYEKGPNGYHTIS